MAKKKLVNRKGKNAPALEVEPEVVRQAPEMSEEEATRIVCVPSEQRFGVKRAFCRPKKRH